MLRIDAQLRIEMQRAEKADAFRNVRGGKLRGHCDGERGGDREEAESRGGIFHSFRVTLFSQLRAILDVAMAELGV